MAGQVRVKYSFSGKLRHQLFILFFHYFNYPFTLHYITNYGHVLKCRVNYYSIHYISLIYVEVTLCSPIIVVIRKTFT